MMLTKTLHYDTINDGPSVAQAWLVVLLGTQNHLLYLGWATSWPAIAEQEQRYPLEGQNAPALRTELWPKLQTWIDIWGVSPYSQEPWSRLKMPFDQQPHSWQGIQGYAAPEDSWSPGIEPPYRVYSGQSIEEYWMIIRNSKASKANSVAQVIQASYIPGQHEALQGVGTKSSPSPSIISEDTNRTVACPQVKEKESRNEENLMDSLSVGSYGRYCRGNNGGDSRRR